MADNARWKTRRGGGRKGDGQEGIGSVDRDAGCLSLRDCCSASPARSGACKHAGWYSARAAPTLGNERGGTERVMAYWNGWRAVLAALICLSAIRVQVLFCTVLMPMQQMDLISGESV
eukprot:c26927_g1_i4 orf=554-907(-)